ncbi:rod-determining factor RdfA [Halorubrum ezzemoulense]|uniref:rod-determining factor RdfA n=1 Tax=Halorubrum ezzemoulense TaxID=337243 RepID=UPI00111C0BD8|nr:rod-determining factor RdfA [Halorubrum ezzemoulense]
MRNATSTRPKIIRVIDKYDLDGIGDEMVAEWTKPESTRRSCRELAEFFNIRVLDAALREAGIIWDRSLVEECAAIIKNKDKSLTGYDLDSRGVDTDEVGGDMVSYQSIYTYLTEYRDTEYEREVDDIHSRVASLGQIETKTETIAAGIISRSVSHSQVHGAEPQIEVTTECICETCGTNTEMSVYLRNGGCPTCSRSR